MKTIVAILFCITCNVAFSQQIYLTAKDSAALLKIATDSMGQYMVTGTPVIVDTIASWKGYELKLYTYKMEDDEATPNLTGSVILCNAPPGKLVSWAINALRKSGIKVNYFNVREVLVYIRGCSGAQFPVRGIVYEDLAKGDKIYETYPFFDGVSIKHKGFDIKTYAIPGKPERATTSQAQMYLTMGFGNIDSVFAAGRIMSTEREEYKRIFPDSNTTGKNWVNIVRMEYQKALKSDENNLIYATVYAHRNSGLNEIVLSDKKTKKILFQK